MSAGQRCVSDTLDPNASQTSVGSPTDVLLSGPVKCAIVHSRWFQTKHRESTHTYTDKLPSKVMWRCLLPHPYGCKQQQQCNATPVGVLLSVSQFVSSGMAGISAWTARPGLTTRRSRAGFIVARSSLCVPGLHFLYSCTPIPLFRHSEKRQLSERKGVAYFKSSLDTVAAP